jgi:hypothetical protein
MDMHGHTEIDDESKLVFIGDLKITDTHFPSLHPAIAAQMDQLEGHSGCRASRFRCIGW